MSQKIVIIYPNPLSLSTEPPFCFLLNNFYPMNGLTNYVKILHDTKGYFKNKVTNAADVF